jgi:DNA-binding NarL/FixJ family response regulator
MLCKELRKRGFDAVNKAATAEDAERMAEELRPDFIFMDIRLIGKRDGIDAAESILAKRDTPIAFMTAYSSEDVRARAQRLGPAAFIVKPVNVQKLAELIELKTGRAS